MSRLCEQKLIPTGDQDWVQQWMTELLNEDKENYVSHKNPQANMY